MENVPLLQVKKMSKAFLNQLVLKEVNLQVERGDIYALVGGNGAGKSTLMKILTGLYSYDDGEMYVKRKEATVFKSVRSTPKRYVFNTARTTHFSAYDY
ncbi:ATP-binding cassette domain-containing protein [Bacillus paranthracis]